MYTTLHYGSSKPEGGHRVRNPSNQLRCRHEEAIKLKLVGRARSSRADVEMGTDVDTCGHVWIHVD